MAAWSALRRMMVIWDRHPEDADVDQLLPGMDRAYGSSVNAVMCAGVTARKWRWSRVATSRTYVLTDEIARLCYDVRRDEEIVCARFE